MLREMIAGLRGLLRRNRIEGEIDEEVRFHLEMETQANVARGMTLTEARRIALRDLGGVTQTKERVQDVRWFSLVDEFRQDLRYALRQIGRHRLVSLGVLAIIATAVATNTALFAIVDGLLLKPLPYRDRARLVFLTLPVATAQRLTPPDRSRVRAVVQETPLLTDRAIEGFAGLFDGQGDLALVNSAVSSNLFDLLGVRPLVGRGVLPDDVGTEPPSIVIGYALWRAQFAADVGIVGRRTALAGRDVVVVGVMPPEFDFPRGTNVWSAAGQFQRQSLPSVARLADHVTVTQLARALAPVEVRPLRDAVRPKGALTLVLLLAGSGFLLLIAWTQVAALQFARFPNRLREIGVRLALGASRIRLFRQFAVEGLVLSIAALGVAWLLSLTFTGVATALLPAEMIRGQHVVADIRVFAFACTLSAVGVVVCAAAPALMLLRYPAADSLRGELFTRQGRSAGSRIRVALLTGQLAVTALLLYTAGLATHAFVAVERLDLGFEPGGLYVVSPPRDPADGTAAPAIRYQQRILALLDTVRQLPGVKGAAGGTTYPLRPGGFVAGLSLPRAPLWTPMTVRMNYVTPDYFEVLRVPMLSGQKPTGVDGRGAAVVNQTLARALAVHGQVIGQHIAVGGFEGEVVGVVGDCVNDRPDQAPEPQVYVSNPIGISLVIARVGDAAATVALVQSVVDRLAYPARGRVVRAIEDDRRRASSDYRARMLLLVVLAAVGISVAVLGVAGGLYHEVRQKTHTIAIRVALGAEGRNITWGILRRALGWAAGAAVAGSLAGAAVGRAAHSLLFNVAGFDSVTALAVCSVLSGVAVAASYPAVRQALAVDPATALRHE